MQTTPATPPTRTLLERLQGASVVGITLGQELYHRFPGGDFLLVAWLDGDTCRLETITRAQAAAWSRRYLPENEFQELFPQEGDSR